MDYEQQGRVFEYRNVIKEPELLQQMLKYSNGIREVPVIVEGERVTIGYKGGS